jgi:hypothetical protein
MPHAGIQFVETVDEQLSSQGRSLSLCCCTLLQETLNVLLQQKRRVRIVLYLNSGPPYAYLDFLFVWTWARG